MSTATDETEAQAIYDTIYAPPVQLVERRAIAAPPSTARRRPTNAPSPRRRPLTMAAAQQRMHDTASYDAELAGSGDG